MDGNTIEVDCTDIPGLVGAGRQSARDGTPVIIRHTCKDPIRHAVEMDDRMSMEDMD